MEETRSIGLMLTVNGIQVELETDPRRSLLDLLREDLGLSGTKKGCDHGQCGACTVHVDGQRKLSCLQFAAQMASRSVTTVEGLADAEGNLHQLQQAFIRHDAMQCGFCTPGQIMSALSLLEEHEHIDSDLIREHMSGNLCRCGAYENIVHAIAEVADELC